MIKKLFLTSILLTASGCALFDRHEEVLTSSSAPVAKEDKKRTTRRSIEEESMLGETSGSLWVTRGQQAYLFTNNNQRLLGDLLTVKLEGYPKEQIQTKMNTISKLLAEILGEQRQEIEFKNLELKRKITPDAPALEPAKPTPVRGLASAPAVQGQELTDEEQAELDAEAAQIRKDIVSNEKTLKKIGDESEEIEKLKTAQDLPLKTISTRITEIQKDGNYKVRGEAPFMIGKREYKLLVMGTVRAEDYDEQGVSAEILVDPTFDVISEKKTEAL